MASDPAHDPNTSNFKFSDGSDVDVKSGWQPGLGLIAVHIQCTLIEGKDSRLPPISMKVSSGQNNKAESTLRV
jgi:hypothetical protein